MVVLREDCISIDIFLSLFDFIIQLTVMMPKILFLSMQINRNKFERGKKNHKMNHTTTTLYDKIDQMKKVIFYGSLKIPPQNSEIQIEALFFHANL